MLKSILPSSTHYQFKEQPDSKPYLDFFSNYPVYLKVTNQNLEIEKVWATKQPKPFDYVIYNFITGVSYPTSL